MAVRKLCVSAGCDDLAEAGQAHCAEHLARVKVRQAERKQEAKVVAVRDLGGHLYQSRRWRRERLQFLKANPLCADCAELGVSIPAREVDHKKPHRGDRKLFWDKRNWQGLCTPCHSRKTANEVWHGKRPGGGQKSKAYQR